MKKNVLFEKIAIIDNPCFLRWIKDIEDYEE